jgi:hypothetical protein
MISSFSSLLEGIRRRGKIYADIIIPLFTKKLKSILTEKLLTAIISFVV